MIKRGKNRVNSIRIRNKYRFEMIIYDKYFLKIEKIKFYRPF